jgi:hypothetical protein
MVILIPNDNGVEVRYNAVCAACAPRTPFQFLTQGDRAVWLRNHLRDTDHSVVLATELRVRDLS